MAACRAGVLRMFMPCDAGGSSDLPWDPAELHHPDRPTSPMPPSRQYEWITDQPHPVHGLHGGNPANR